MTKKARTKTMSLAVAALFALLLIEFIWDIQDAPWFHTMVIIIEGLIVWSCFWIMWKIEHSKFSALGIEAGAVLRLERNPEISCVVAGKAGEQPKHQRVVFEGEEMTLSAAGRRALDEQGFTLAKVKGTRCWEYEGRSLESLLLDLEIGKTTTLEPVRNRLREVSH